MKSKKEFQLTPHSLNKFDAKKTLELLLSKNKVKQTIFSEEELIEVLDIRVLVKSMTKEWIEKYPQALKKRLKEHAYEKFWADHGCRKIKGKEIFEGLPKEIYAFCMECYGEGIADRNEASKSWCPPMC